MALLLGDRAPKSLRGEIEPFVDAVTVTVFSDFGGSVSRPVGGDDELMQVGRPGKISAACLCCEMGVVTEAAVPSGFTDLDGAVQHISEEHGALG